MMQKDDFFLCRALQQQDVVAVAAFEAAVQDGWSKQGIAAALTAPAARCYVACAHPAQPAAFAAFTLVEDQANLDALSVEPTHRRTGLAAALLRYAFAQLQQAGARQVFLEVRSQNAPAIALYEKLGFARCGLRKNFYEAPQDDAVLMQRSL